MARAKDTFREHHEPSLRPSASVDKEGDDAKVLHQLRRSGGDKRR